MKRAGAVDEGGLVVSFYPVLAVESHLRRHERGFVTGLLAGAVLLLSGIQSPAIAATLGEAVGVAINSDPTTGLFNAHYFV